MPSQVVIRNRSGYRKPLDIYTLVQNDLAYGVHDSSWRLKEGELAEGRVVIYNPEHIGRGIEVQWSDFLNRDVRLSLPLPCTIHDMDVLYRVTSRIMAYWDADSFRPSAIGCPMRHRTPAASMRRKSSTSVLFI